MEISSQLPNICFSDIVPCDLEAEENARRHLKEGGIHDKIAATRDIEARSMFTS